MDDLDIMKIVTTPMCEKILEFAGILQYKVNKNPDEEEGDLAILLSENKVEMDSLNIKLNTFSQIKESIIEVSKLKSHFTNSKTPNSNDKNYIYQKTTNDIFSQYFIANKWVSNEAKDLKEKNSKIKVKVCSNFLKDIVKDMGFYIVDDSINGLSEESGDIHDIDSVDDFVIDSMKCSDFDYLILPDYMDVGDIYDENNYNYKVITIPTHKNVPLDPIKRAELRYSILSDLK